VFAGINVVSIAVPDLAAAKAFYAETLALGTRRYDIPEAGWIEFACGAAQPIWRSRPPRAPLRPRITRPLS
jgi:catechol 2,3-dioxygenase-like lactoylglutathione lyase family enzyme